MGRGGRIRTPGSLPERESCIRTLIVSRGWQHSWEHNVRRPDVYVSSGQALGGVRTASMAPAMPPAVKWVANPTGFFSDDMVVLWSCTGLQARLRVFRRPFPLPKSRGMGLPSHVKSGGVR